MHYGEAFINRHSISFKEMLGITNQLKWIMVLVVGFLLRYMCYNSSLYEIFKDRIEISTPVSSWKRVTEGVYLYRSGVSPYDGDVFHEVPLALWLYDFLIQNCYNSIAWIFMACDMISGLLLALASKVYLADLIKLEHKRKVPQTAKHLIVKNSDVERIPFYILCVYLFCPYTILSSVGQSTSTFSNLFMAIALATLVSKWWFPAAIATAILIYHSFYPIVLLVPLLLAVYNDRKKWNIIKTLAILIIVLCTLVGLLFLSNGFTGNWKFICSTYGTIMAVPDLTPNIGLFWYFFTEMFEQFRVLFLWTFQINVFIYAIPLAIRFWSEPVLLFYVQLFMMAIFKSYPGVGDYVLPMALLPMWKHTFHYMRQSFLVGCILSITFILAPLLWHLWIYAGSANSNFYFGITLAFNTAQIFLITDLLFAHCKRDYHLEKGIELDENGKPLRLDLK